ncbi:MAG: hypothetical protein M0Z62_01595, partial [Actinomycetota bacterium]|nr:hypothetical protein [Actinomycetota bacterium]
MIGRVFGAGFLLVGVAAAGVASGQADALGTVTFATQGCTTWTVPSGFSGAVTVNAVGSAGQSVGGWAAGTGDGVSETISVTAGQAYEVCVDVNGGAGGAGGSANGKGGAGGGASSFSLGSSFVIVAGGGGGASNNDPDAAGSAGNPAGSAGSPSHFSGGGGTQSAGGVGGTDTTAGVTVPPGAPGTGPAVNINTGAIILGSGGAGGNISSTGNAYSGGAGGGGAGLYGGGGGAAGAVSGGGEIVAGNGGGGSDYCSATCTVASGAGTQFGAGTTPGDAEVTITPVVVSPTVAVTAPATGTYGITIGATSVNATVSGGNSPGGSLTFDVFGPGAAPTTCTGGTAVGASVPVSGNGTYHPTAGFTPVAPGDYWWYVSYSGDPNNNPASTPCGASMPETVVGQGTQAPLTITTTNATYGQALTLVTTGGTTGGTVTYQVTD